MRPFGACDHSLKELPPLDKGPLEAFFPSHTDIDNLRYDALMHCFEGVTGPGTTPVSPLPVGCANGQEPPTAIPSSSIGIQLRHFYAAFGSEILQGKRLRHLPIDTLGHRAYSIDTPVSRNIPELVRCVLIAYFPGDYSRSIEVRKQRPLVLFKPLYGRGVQLVRSVQESDLLVLIIGIGIDEIGLRFLCHRLRIQEIGEVT